MNKYFILALFGQLLASISQIMLKKSAGKKYTSFIREYLNVLVIGGYILMVVSMLIAIICYGGLGYMNVIVLEPLGYIIVMILSRYIFGEKFDKAKISGMSLIVLGIIVYYIK
ncbi:MAG: multidrug ABC transporter [Butyrivibrio sp.]|nr:multidrug ABC transporter [Butyrivibrio sp.]